MVRRIEWDENRPAPHQNLAGTQVPGCISEERVRVSLYEAPVVLQGTRRRTVPVCPSNVRMDKDNRRSSRVVVSIPVGLGVEFIDEAPTIWDPAYAEALRAMVG